MRPAVGTSIELSRSRHRAPGESQVVLAPAIVLSQMETSEILQSSGGGRVSHPLCLVPVFAVSPQKLLHGVHDHVAKGAAGLG